MSTGRTPTRDEALALVRRYITDERLMHHALAVEGVMRHMARKSGEDEDRWGIVGLIHDLDWEKFPDEHCRKTAQILAQEGWPDEYIRAAVSHGWGICSDVEPSNALEKTLFAVDELTGLVVATALVRPSRSVLDMKVKSVMKKWKAKGFAAGASRDIIRQGADRLGVSLQALIEDVIMGMRDVAEAIGLKGDVVV